MRLVINGSSGAFRLILGWFSHKCIPIKCKIWKVLPELQGQLEELGIDQNSAENSGINRKPPIIPGCSGEFWLILGWFPYECIKIIWKIIYKPTRDPEPARTTQKKTGYSVKVRYIPKPQLFQVLLVYSHLLSTWMQYHHMEKFEALNQKSGIRQKKSRTKQDNTR